ncbi:MAG: hypothetical protein WC538_24220 [Thermoanaerobaculia bacterium]|jgi:hypothetical protein
MRRLFLAALTCSICLATAADGAPPRIDWPGFFATVGATGATWAPELKKLDGKPVIVRGYAVTNPPLEGGAFLTRFQHDDPHDVEESDLPFDAVAVVWDRTIDVGSVPVRPTVVGTLRLGNRTYGGSAVMITIENARPWIDPAQPASR